MKVGINFSSKPQHRKGMSAVSPRCRTIFLAKETEPGQIEVEEQVSEYRRKEGRKDATKLGPVSLSYTVRQWASFTQTHPHLQRHTYTRHRGVLSHKLLLLLLHNVWLSLFHYAPFFVLSCFSTRFWFSFSWLLVFVWLIGGPVCFRVWVRTPPCHMYLACAVWLLMITKANFSCEIPLTLCHWVAAA